jgi:hypothetical protein
LQFSLRKRQPPENPTIKPGVSICKLSSLSQRDERGSVDLTFAREETVFRCNECEWLGSLHAVRLFRTFAAGRAPLLVRYSDIITQREHKARFVHADFAGECGTSNGVDKRPQSIEPSD